MAHGLHPAQVVPTPEERAALTGRVRRPKTAQALAVRARIVLTRLLAARVGPSQTAVIRIWRAFAIALHRGTVIGETHRRHRSREFRQFLDANDGDRPSRVGYASDSDNSAVHTTPLSQRWLAKRPRFHVDFTSAS